MRRHNLLHPGSESSATTFPVGFDCVRTVPKLDLLKPLGLLLSEKQIPQVVVNIRNQS